MLQLYPASNTNFMSIDKPTFVLKRSFWKFFERILFTLRHLQSFVVAFIEQVQIIEKSTASVFEVVSYFATVKARIQERQSHVSRYQAKLNQHLENSAKARIMTLIHLVKLTTLFAEFKCFD